MKVCFAVKKWGKKWKQFQVGASAACYFSFTAMVEGVGGGGKPPFFFSFSSPWQKQHGSQHRAGSSACDAGWIARMILGALSSNAGAKFTSKIEQGGSVSPSTTPQHQGSSTNTV